MTRAFVFPGQGSQTVGMGRDLHAAFQTARDVFEEVDEALQQKLSRIIFEGPESELQLTENAQPALMTVSLAAMRVMAKEGGLDLKRHAAYIAGHSLGEYSALAAADALTLADAALEQARRVGQRQGIGGGERGIFAERMAGDVRRMTLEVEPAFLGHDAHRREAHRHQGGLGVLRELKLAFGAFEDDPGKLLLQRLIDFLEHVARRLKGGVQVAAHADGLRALPRENESAGHRL